MRLFFSFITINKIFGAKKENKWKAILITRPPNCMMYTSDKNVVETIKKTLASVHHFGPLTGVLLYHEI